MGGRVQLVVLIGVLVGCSDSARPGPDGGSPPRAESSSGGMGADAGVDAAASPAPSGDTTADAARDQDDDRTAPADPLVLADHAAFCEAWGELVCTRQAACCEAGGSRVNVAHCALEWRWADPACDPAGRQQRRYDGGAAVDCLQAQPTQRDDCSLEPRDATAYQHAEERCEAVAPLTGPGPGEDCDFPTGCVAPPGQISVCLTADDNDVDWCSRAMPRAPVGAPCGDGCLEALVCSAGDLCVEPPPAIADGDACSDGACASGHCGDDGRCAPPPVIDDDSCARHDEIARYALYVEPNNSAEIVVNGSEVLWRRTVGVIPDDVRRAPKDGSGSVTGLDVEGSQLPSIGSHLLATDEALYYVDSFSIERISLEDGGRTGSAEPGFAAAAMIRVGEELVVASSACARVARVSLEDGTPEVHPSELQIDDPAANGNVRVAADAETIYCAHGSHLARFPRGGDGEILSAETFDHSEDLLLRGLQLVGGGLYVQTVRNFPIDPEYALTRYDLATGTLTPVDAIAAVGEHVLADPARGHLYRHTGAGIQVYTPGEDRFDLLELDYTSSTRSGFAQDDTQLYWTTGRLLLRREKP